jgi:hypothetical protein
MRLLVARAEATMALTVPESRAAAAWMKAMPSRTIISCITDDTYDESAAEGRSLLS